MKRFGGILLVTAVAAAMAAAWVVSGAKSATTAATPAAAPTTAPATAGTTDDELAAKIVRGKDGWLFWAPRQWVYAEKSNGPRKNMEVVVDFDKQLKGAGIQLLVVMLPDQAYAARDKWPDAKAVFERKHFEDAFAWAQQQGVNVIDMTPTVEKMRADGKPVALAQDAHLSPGAYEVIAKEIADAVAKVATIKGRAKDFSVAPMRAEEPATAAEAAKVASLHLQTTFNCVKHTRVPQLIQERPGSEVMIMGDSNVVEFSSIGASLAEHIARDLGVVPDVCSRYGANSSQILRQDLARRKDNLEGTKVVVWTFLEGSMVYDDAWTKVTVIQK